MPWEGDLDSMEVKASFGPMHSALAPLLSTDASLRPTVHEVAEKFKALYSYQVRSAIQV